MLLVVPGGGYDHLSIKENLPVANRFLKEKSIKNLYMRTINYFTFKCYSCIFSIVNIEKFI